jgi:hypothetical protein
MPPTRQRAPGTTNGPPAMSTLGPRRGRATGAWTGAHTFLGAAPRHPGTHAACSGWNGSNLNPHRHSVPPGTGVHGPAGFPYVRAGGRLSRAPRARVGGAWFASASVQVGVRRRGTGSNRGVVRWGVSGWTHAFASAASCSQPAFFCRGFERRTPPPKGVARAARWGFPLSGSQCT